MTPDQLDALRTLAASLPASAAIPVPAGWLLDLTAEQTGGAAPQEPPPGLPVPDLSVHQLAIHFGRKDSTIRTWLERGLLPGSYKLFGKYWRCPVFAVSAFELAQRQQPATEGPADTVPRPRRGRGHQSPDLGAWRRVS